jgi:hypothetical protein
MSMDTVYASLFCTAETEPDPYGRCVVSTETLNQKIDPERWIKDRQEDGWTEVRLVSPGEWSGVCPGHSDYRRDRAPRR